ncbi:1-phosphatidylinositol phosphodiesterase [Filimonas lacunae]|uniref:1-phosphatidylinositol phosphodiesterase n=1 Tax=Filimonas lacunae TaxID=477680 RepID=A0A173M9X1_9BACT|nr:phosphatidylinositol-specific phospholipase C [Filimonas lacunae]BAV04335.1 phosphatidylinositol-specific phospholipase C [Filimonas lacunae]SIT31059.1 1-phosphatidylinositol phosphodiesterase [Filimonas lacunae]
MKKTNIRLSLLSLVVAVVLFSCKKEADVNPVNPNAGKGLTAEGRPMVFASKTTVTASAWMASVADEISLSMLSIPGSHDAGATVEPVSGTAKCQTLSIGDQLSAGIRFVDIRCRHIDNAFAIHHGSVYQNLNFDDVLNACFTFLNTHPGETIVMSVKEEYNSSNITRTFEETFNSYVAKNPSQWYTGASVPTLGQVRGKIVLLRRFSASVTPKGIDATNWADNTTFSITNSNAQLRIEDNYVVNDNSAKWSNVTSLLSEAKTGLATTMYITFTSGYKPLIFSIPSITSVSGTINPNVTSYFTTNTTGRYGIIPMDFSEASRASLIYQTNF